MADIKITKAGYIPVTTVPDDFIKNYMPTANGDYVKIFLYLLYCTKSNENISVQTMADFFQCTENDIRRALKYWESKGLLDSEDQPESVPTETAAPEKHTYSAIETKAFKEQAEVKQLLFVCEQYIGKPLTRTDLETLLYFYEELHFSTDLIEYLVEYSVSKNKRSLRYMESVALEWHKKGIRTIEEAKLDSKPFSKECYLVLKALGINNHDPLPTETAYVKRWMEEYGFTIDIILEACKRTIMQIHQPKFEYVDGILKSWKRDGVHHLADIEKLTAEHRSKADTASSQKQNQPVSTKFHGFEQRKYKSGEFDKFFIN